MAEDTDESVEKPQEESSGTRHPAAEESGEHVDAYAAGRLAEALSAPDLAARRSAVWSLRSLGVAAEDELYGLLRAPDAGRRMAGVRGLAVLGRDAMTILARVLECPEPEVRQAITRPLGRSDDPVAVEHLLETLADDDEELRQAAWVSLSEIGERPLAEAVRNALRGDPRPLIALREPRALAPLRYALGSRYAFVRRAAVMALGQMAHPDALEPLLQALEDPETDVRHAAIDALGILGDARAVEPLIAVLEDGADRLRPTAAEALGHIRDPRAVTSLTKALRDPAVGRSAATALGMLGAAAGAALEPLRTLARSGDDSLRWVCQRAIKQIQEGLKAAPTELQAASPPEGTGTEPEAASAPEQVAGVNGPIRPLPPCAAGEADSRG